MDVHTIDTAGAARAVPPDPAFAQPPVPNSGPPLSLPGQSAHPGDPSPRGETLHGAISQIAGNGSAVNVSFRVLSHPHQIVTVFKDEKTGEVISEFPSETMVLIAQFFDKLAGAVLDKQA